MFLIYLLLVSFVLATSRWCWFASWRKMSQGFIDRSICEWRRSQRRLKCVV